MTDFFLFIFPQSLIYDMYKPIDFRTKDYLFYPENVREIKKIAQKAAYMKSAIYCMYQRCEPGEKKQEIYQRLIDIQYIIGRAWKIVEDWEPKGHLKFYTKAIEEKYDKELESLELSLGRIKETYNEIRKEGK